MWFGSTSTFPPLRVPGNVSGSSQGIFGSGCGRESVPRLRPSSARSIQGEGRSGPIVVGRRRPCGRQGGVQQTFGIREIKYKFVSQWNVTILQEYGIEEVEHENEIMKPLIRMLHQHCRYGTSWHGWHYSEENDRRIDDAWTRHLPCWKIANSVDL